MGLARYAIHIKRKFRAILIFAVALVVTATVAYNRGSSISYDSVSISRLIEKDNGLNVRPLIQRNIAAAHASSARETHGFPSVGEHLGDYDTHDLYNEVAGRNAGNLSSKSPLPRTKEKLKVFILPFTHVDPGWLRTFDSYSEDTDKILNNMHKFMMKNPKMTFMWAEFVFFERWWTNQTEEVKKDVRELVSSGRFEFASGSWVMTDEANAYFPVSVDNIVEGHQFLKREFDIKPSVVWSNDPFGYSNSVPYLFRQAGLKRNVINRIHHEIKGFLQKKRAIPFRWQQYFDSSKESDVLTQILPYTHYDILNSCGPNQGNCCEFDFKRMTHWNCPGPAPVPITPANVKQKANTLLSQLETMSEMYQSPVLLMMHGDDFRFDMIEEWHQHHDNFIPLFEEINKGDRAEIRFGTFSDYFNEMEKWYETKEVQPASVTGDFFPYRCALGDMWTGYFTTRPFYKRQGRLLHTLIRSGDLLFAQADHSLDPTLKSQLISQLTSARRTLSLFQHHDAITGTSKIHVMKDYSRLLYEATNATRNVIEQSMRKIIKSPVTMTYFPSSAENTQSKIAITVEKEKPVYISVFNPLPYLLEDTVSIRVETHLISVMIDGKPVKSQIEPFVMMGDIAQKTYLLTVPVTLPPLATTSLQLNFDESSSTTSIAKISVTSASVNTVKETLPKIFTIDVVDASALLLETAQLKTTHSADGWLESVSTSNTNYPLKQKFVLYSNSAGGAYLMRMRGGEGQALKASDPPRFLVSGPVQNSIHVFTPKVYQRMTAKHVNGPLGAQLDLHLRVNILKERNTELMLQFEADSNMNKIYSDSVGLQLLRREPMENLAMEANYYPMPSAAVMESGKNRITVSSNVEHGMRPMANGIEINIDRMLNQDDGKGLGSTQDAIPTDLRPVDMQFSIMFETATNKDGSHFKQHTAAGLLSVQNVLYPPVVVAGSAAPSATSSSLPAMPCDYQLLTVRPISEDKKLLVLYRHGAISGNETGESCGTKATTALRAYLNFLGVKTVQETLLSGVDNIGQSISPNDVTVSIQPYKFLTLILS